MATLNFSEWTQGRSATRGPLHRAIASFSAWRAEQRRKDKVLRELSTYTDRELFDLGISRADFPAIVNGTYRR